MITPTQREAFAVLAEVCELSPDVRLGQLLAQLGFLGEDQTGCSLGEIDDEQLLAVFYHDRAELAERQPDSSNNALRPADRGPHRGFLGFNVAGGARRLSFSVTARAPFPHSHANVTRSTRPLLFLPSDGISNKTSAILRVPAVRLSAI